MFGIIIPTKGRKTLTKTLDSIVKNSKYVDCICIVSNTNKDSIKPIVDTYYGILENKVNFVYDTSLNFGELYITGVNVINNINVPYTFILDDDDELFGSSTLKTPHDLLIKSNAYCYIWNMLYKHELASYNLCKAVVSSLAKELCELDNSYICNNLYELFSNGYLFSSTIFPTDVLHKSLLMSVDNTNFLNTHNDMLVFLNSLNMLKGGSTLINKSHIGIVMGDNKDHYSHGVERTPYVLYSLIDTCTNLRDKYSWIDSWEKKVIEDLSKDDPKTGDIYNKLQTYLPAIKQYIKARHLYYIVNNLDKSKLAQDIENSIAEFST